MNNRQRRPSLAIEGVIIPEGETLDAKTVQDETGKKLNQYNIGRVLGKGSYGTVYIAFDENLKISVAIKEFSKTKLRKEKARKSGAFLGVRGRGRGGAGGSLGRTSTPPENSIELLRGEIAILKKLNHVNVVKLFEVLDDPDQDYLYMVFELCEKGPIINISLDSVAKPLSIQEARKYFCQMILGIEYLHEQSICHRDIKPDNMMISKDGILKLVDFGVSEMFARENDKLVKEAGSPAFYPPELCAAHHGDVSCRASDIWALGVTLYCLIFGKLPFIGTNVIKLYENIRNEDLSLPQNLDSDLANLLHRMLDKNPETRTTLNEIRNHKWVTQNGQYCLISKEENCSEGIGEITDADLSSAIKPINSIFTVLKAVSKFKRSVSGVNLAKSSSSINSGESGSPIPGKK